MYSFARENESFEYFLVATAILGGIGNGGSDGGDNGNGGSCNGTSSVGTIQENQVNELKCKITYTHTICIYLSVHIARNRQYQRSTIETKCFDSDQQREIKFDLLLFTNVNKKLFQPLYLQF